MNLFSNPIHEYQFKLSDLSHLAEIKEFGAEEAHCVVIMVGVESFDVIFPGIEKKLTLRL